MLQVAFLRNVNQGQVGHPTTSDIRDAFAAAGHPDAVTFQSNGTVIFESEDPDSVADTVITTLSSRAGIERDCFSIPLADIAEIVDVHAPAPDIAHRELTLHHAGTIDITDEAVRRTAADLECTIIDADDGWIVTLNHRDRGGNGTRIAEVITGDLASSRGLPTLIRLVNRFAR